MRVSQRRLLVLVVAVGLAAATLPYPGSAASSRGVATPTAVPGVAHERDVTPEAVGY